MPTTRKYEASLKKIILLILLTPFVAFAQTPARWDLPALMTTPNQVPKGSLPNLLAVTNATVSVCGYPAVLSGGMCTNTITTYTDSSLGTACPSTAQLTAPGSTACVSTTGMQGSFGFWYDASVQKHLTYTVNAPWGTFGPYDILQSGVTSGGGSPGGQNQAVQLNQSGSFGGDVNTLSENTSAHTATAANLITALPHVDARAAQFAGGADPTGTNDSTAAFQAAINFAVAQEAYGVGGNPSVYCAPGNYKINGTLTIPGYINFVGDGTATCDLIETNATANLITITWADVAATAHGSLRNVTLEGSGESTTGTLLEVDNAPGFTIDNIELFNNGGRGLQLNGASERFSSHNLKIDQVRWPIIMPADENESYFVNTQITYPGQVASGYCYSINCVNGVAPGPNQGGGGTATPISPDTHAAIYVDGAENFRFLGGSIKPLGYMAGFQNFNSSLGILDNFYFEGLYSAPWASDSPAIEVGGAAPRTTLSADITGTALTAPVTSTDWQPYFYEDPANIPTNSGEGATYILMPADYLSGSTDPSADVPGVERGQFEKITAYGFAGDGDMHIASRNIGGSTAPAGTAWPAGTVVEEAPHTYGGFGALTIASDHFNAQLGASSGYAKNCNQLNTLTCAEIVAGFEPDGYWIDPTGGFNSNLVANVILHGDEMYNGSDPYVGQIATHDNANISISGYAALNSGETSEVATSPYKYSIGATLGGSYITAPTYSNGRTANTLVTNLADHSTWGASAGVYSAEVDVPGDGQGRQYTNQYCFYDVPASGTQPTQRFCFNGGPGSGSGYKYETWSQATGWTAGINDNTMLFDNLGIAAVPGKIDALTMFSEAYATSGNNQSSLPIIYQSQVWNGSASVGCHVHTWVDSNDVFQYELQGGEDPACKAATVNLPGGSTTSNLGGVWPVAGIAGTVTPGHIAVFDSTGQNVSDGGAPSGSGTVTAASFPTSPSWLTPNVTNPTTTPTIALTPAPGLPANEFLATPNGSTGPVSPRAIVPADIPTLNQNTTGNAATAAQLAATPTVCSAGNAPTGILANGNATGCQPVGGGGGGAVSSVSNSDGSLTVTPITGAVVASINLAHANIFTAVQSAPSFSSTGTGAALNATEGAEQSPVSGHDILNASSTNHCMEYSANGGAFTCLASLPSATAAGQALISSGAGTTYTAQKVNDYAGSVANSSYYAVDPTGATDSTAAIQSMMNAAGTFAENNPFLANATVTTPGGGVVHLKQGIYKVTGTLLYRSGMIFEGDGDGTQIQFCPTVSGTDLFSPDTNHWAWNNSMEKPIFRNFSISIPPGCATASDARYAFNMTNANRSEINSVKVGSGFTIAFYYTLTSTAGQGYYNTIYNPWVFGALTNALYVDGPPTVANASGGNNSINVYGGDFRDIGGSFSKSYCVVNKAQSLNLYGTALECNVTSAQVDAEGPTGLYGGYSENPGQANAAPIIDVDDAVANRITGGSVMQGYLGGIVRMHNVVQTAQVPSADASAVIQPMELNQGSPVPITSQMIVNANMDAASSGWSAAASGLPTNGTCAQSSTYSLAGFSTHSYAMVNTGAGTLTCGQTIPYTALAPYTGSDIMIAIWLKTDGTQNILLSFYGACGSYGSGTGCQGAQISQPVVIRDDGWSEYVMDVPIVSATDATQALTFYVEQTGAAANTTLYIGGANAYVGGWEAFPVAH